MSAMGEILLLSAAASAHRHLVCEYSNLTPGQLQLILHTEVMIMIVSDDKGLTLETSPSYSNRKVTTKGLRSIRHLRNLIGK